MHFRFWRLSILTALTIVLAVAGCAGLRGSRGVPEPLRPNKVSLRDASRQLLLLFPQKVGTKCHYEGFAEYGHDMALNSVKPYRNGVVHRITGAVVDVSSGESTRDFRFTLEYVFTGREVRERILRSDTPFPHRIDGLVLLRLPLKTGAEWKHSARVQGKTRTVRAKVLKVEDREGLPHYTVRYRAPMAGMPGGIYEEVRVYRRGDGVVGFENTFDANPEDRFNYALYRIERAGSERVNAEAQSLPL